MLQRQPALTSESIENMEAQSKQSTHQHTSSFVTQIEPEIGTVKTEGRNSILEVTQKAGKKREGLRRPSVHSHHDVAVKHSSTLERTPKLLEPSNTRELPKQPSDANQKTLQNRLGAVLIHHQNTLPTEKLLKSTEPLSTSELPKTPQPGSDVQHNQGLLSRQDTILKHQQSTLPTVEVRGNSVEYYYQGVPGHSKSFKPDIKTRALLRKTSQITSTLRYLQVRQDSRSSPNSSQDKEDGEGEEEEEEHEDDSHDDDNVHKSDRDEMRKEEFENILKGWSKVATKRQKKIKDVRRKAKMRSVLMMKSAMKKREHSVVPDPEDRSLSGWQLLRLYRIWSNATTRPVWATGEYQRRRQQDGEDYRIRQGQGQGPSKPTDLQTTVLQAMSAGTVTKQAGVNNPETSVGIATKKWARSSKSVVTSDQLSSLTSKTTPTSHGHISHQVSSLSDKNNSLTSRHFSKVANTLSTHSNKTRGQFKGSGRLVANVTTLRGSTPFSPGRKEEVGREMHMSVGNMVLSTGLTGTVAKSRRRPDFFVKTDDSY
ncbi:uncharacterized protein [Littorina saxatilis]|uniref:uncharacterized protein n=1 Tax=Littorina saxatilis TaxID=31220 RepID=UPI0038B5EEF1